MKPGLSRDVRFVGIKIESVTANLLFGLPGGTATGFVLGPDN